MSEGNANARLEAFSDGVFAIAITLLIIELRLPADGIRTTADFWRALQYLAPSVFAFVLSFVIILISWVNHHAAFKLLARSSAPFIYANGFLLLTAVFMPFPTGMLGEFLWTDHAAPAVVVYNAVLAIQAVAWVLTFGSALKGGLARDDAAAKVLRANQKSGYSAIVLYGALAVVAVWFPTVAVVVTTATFVFWLALSARMKHA